MRFLFNASGANTPLIKEYDIDKTLVVTAGEVLGIADSKVVKAEDGEGIIGVCAEEHTGTFDELNSRSNGGKIRVNIAPQAVYEVATPVFTAKSGSATTIVTSSTGLSSSVVSGTAILISKADNSTNTDEIGTKREISAVSVSGSNATITLASGGTAYVGDEYMILPHIGDEMYLDEAGVGCEFYVTGGTVKLKVICRNEQTGKIGVKIKTHLFA